MKNNNLVIKKVRRIYYIKGKGLWKGYCSICGKHRKVTAHHVIPKRLKCNHKFLSELRISVCKECQKVLHPEHIFFQMKTYKEILKIAEKIARKSHEGQKRWDGLDYTTHPEAVAKLVHNDKLKIIAWLHDVLEDTTTSQEDLYDEGIPENIMSSVRAITHKKNETYKNYIIRCSVNYCSSLVKLADLKHNLLNLLIPSNFFH